MKQAWKTIQSYCSRCKRPELSRSSAPLKLSVGEFEELGAGCRDHKPSVLLIGLTPKEKCIFSYHHNGRFFYNLEQGVLQSSLLPSHRDWELGPPSSWWLFQKLAPRSLRKTAHGCESGRRLFKRFTSQKSKELTITSFLKQMFWEKGMEILLWLHHLDSVRAWEGDEGPGGREKSSWGKCQNVLVNRNTIDFAILTLYSAI